MVANRGIMSSMKIKFLYASSALVALVAPVAQADTTPDAILGFLSELPFLAVTVWLFLKLAAIHQTTVDSLIDDFNKRDERRSISHDQTVGKLLDTVSEIARSEGKS